MNYEDAYHLAETENQNLRDKLALAASMLTDAERNELERRLDVSIDDGGVTSTSVEEERQDLVVLLGKIVAHVEPLLEDPRPPSTKRPQWYARLDQLLRDARGYEPKHPVMVRIGGHPNVFGPARDPDHAVPIAVSEREVVATIVDLRSRLEKDDK